MKVPYLVIGNVMHGMNKICGLLITIYFLSGCSKGVDTLPCCASEPVILNFSGNVIAFPNAFSPNGNGMNDIYQPVVKLSDSSVITNFKLTISKRGKVIFSESENIEAFKYSEMTSQLLEVTYNITHVNGVEAGSLTIISFASGCFPTEGYVFSDQFDKDGRIVRDKTLEGGCY